VPHPGRAISIVARAMFCERIRFRYRFDQLIGHLSMAESAVSRILVGPYGLHAFGAVVLFLFFVFLWVFNFTTFF
jgi:hypothetical protein